MRFKLELIRGLRPCTDALLGHYQISLPFVHHVLQQHISRQYVTHNAIPTLCLRSCSLCSFDIGLHGLSTIQVLRVKDLLSVELPLDKQRMLALHVRFASTIFQLS